MTSISHFFDLTGRVAVVTGAAGLLGVKHCEALAAAGANLVALDLNVAGVCDLAGRLTAEFGPLCLGLECDVAEPEQVERAVDETVARFGRVDALVNNARRIYREEEPVGFEDLSLEIMRQDLRVQLEGTLLCSQKFGAQMVKQRRGAVVNICSIYGLVGPDQRMYQNEDDIKTGTPVYYSIGKSALVGLTKYLAAYWGPVGVRVNLLTPGGIRSDERQSETFVRSYAERVPLGRMAQPDEMQGAIVFLCSDASRYMTGANLVIDGGWTAW